MFYVYLNLVHVMKELKSFASEDVVQFKSIISRHEKVCRFMRKRIDELELEKV